MVTEKEISDWYSGKSITGISFTIDSPATVTSGDHSGELVALISLESTSPEVSYLAENSIGESFIVKQVDLEHYT